MTQWFPWKRLFGRAGLLEPPIWPPPVVDEPAHDETVRVLSPVAAPVHVYSGSALVRVDNGVLIVERPNEPRFERPIELVSAVHVHGWASITSPCVAELISQGAPVIWRGATGYPIGYACPLHSAGLEARRSQYAAVESSLGFDIARALVAAKIVNMRGLVRRRAALPGRNCLEALQRHAKRAETASTHEILLGIEGAATAVYFAAWPEMISARAGDMTFETRSRRPPRDKVNALLSYTYAVLAGESLSACAAAGLDPRQGFLHRPRPGRPALALDLMEPFRPIIADQAVLAGLNNGQFNASHFAADGHATRLTEDGRRLALDLLERRLLGPVTPEGRAQPVAWRELLGMSARALADALKGQTRYAPVERG